MKHIRSSFAALCAVLTAFSSFAADTPPSGVTLVDLTTSTSGSVTSSGASYNDSANWAASKAFDGVTTGSDNRWLTKSVADAWLVYQFNTPTAVNAYTIVNGGTGGASQTERAPKTWTFSGSNDGETWTTLDTRDGETGWKSGESRYFSCKTSDGVAYTYYKYHCTANNNQALVQIHEMYFYDVREYTVASPALTDLGDGRWKLTGTIKDFGTGTAKLVFSTAGAADVEVDIGAYSRGESIAYTFDPEAKGLDLTKTYTAKIVVPDGGAGTVTALRGLYGAVASVPKDFRCKFTFVPSESALSKIGVAAYAEFPVLVRLSTAIAGFGYNVFGDFGGKDMMFLDENGTSLPFEVETWNTSGESLVWVKVPSLTAATELTCYFGSDKPGHMSATPEDVWTRYVGVWHFNPAEAGGTTVTDATGHGLDGASTANLTTYAGPFGGDALTATAAIKAPDYEATHKVGAAFTASGWFKCPNFAGTTGAYSSFVSKKSGLSWNEPSGWYVQMNQSKTSAGIVLTSTEYRTTIPDVTKNWNYYTVVSDGSSVKVYWNGATFPTVNQSYKVVANSTQYIIGGGNNCEDEYRIRKGAASAAETALEYQTMANAAFFDYDEVKVVDDTMPTVNDVAATRQPNGDFVISALIGGNLPSTIVAIVGANEYPMTAAEGALPKTYSATASALAADTTFDYGVKVTSTSGNALVVAGASALYSGALAIEKVSDANEYGLVPGVFRISRADSGSALTVNFLVDEDASTAIAGQTYVTPVSPVTIPAEATSVDVEIVPLVDAATASNTVVKVDLAPGLYGVDPTAGSMTMTILNLSTPEGWNTWVATEAGLASVGSNWSEGRAPVATDKILFDGRFSNANCEWDADASHAVAAWKQEGGDGAYAGTVTVDTKYDGGFTVLDVSGDMQVLSGKMTHQRGAANVSTATYRLKLSVGGDFALGSAATIDLLGKGFAGGQKPSGATAGSHAASADGYDKVYGNVYMPDLPGAGAEGANKWGGGALWLEASGAATIDGNISVRGEEADNIKQAAAGSAYIKAKSCAGAGHIYANYAAATGYANGGKGSGGRVAIVLTEATSLAFPEANVAIQGVICNKTGGGGGTFFYKTASQANGTLVLDDYRYKDYARRWRLPTSITAIPAGETWKFDAIKIRNYGMLAIPEGTTLELPNGPASITSSSTRQGGILYQGGTIKWGGAPYVFNQPWIFQANVPYTFDGDVTIQSGGCIGCMTYQGANDFSNMTKCDITVNGKLTVEKGGFVYATGGGPDMEGVNRNSYAYHGGSTSNSACLKLVYDSVFDPRYPGYTAADGDAATTRPGGGVLLLDVKDELVVNGTIAADGALWGDIGASGAGGTVNIRAKSLFGEGNITANASTENRWTWFNVGGAGRVSVRLTGGTFTDYWKAHITAKGRSMWNTNKTHDDHGASAGTVFLQESGESGTTGTVVVRNDNSADPTQAYTYLPVTPTAKCPTDDLAAYKSAALVVGGKALVNVSGSFRLRSLAIETGSSLDLAGKTLTVVGAKLGGTKLKPGTYTAASAEVAGYVIDSDEGGELIVKSVGLVLLVQ